MDVSLQADVPDQPMAQDAAAIERLSFVVGQKVKIVNIAADGGFRLESVSDGSDVNVRIKNAVLGVVPEPTNGKIGAGERES